MRTIKILNEEDLKVIVADRFFVKPDDVEINIVTKTVGYGMDEHDVKVPEVKIDLGEEKHEDPYNIGG